MLSSHVKTRLQLVKLVVIIVFIYFERLSGAQRAYLLCSCRHGVPEHVSNIVSPSMVKSSLSFLFIHNQVATQSALWE